MSQFRNDKFTGGLTDGTLNPDPSQATELVNFLPDEFGKLVRRSGIEFYNPLNPQLPSGNTPVVKIFSTTSTPTGSTTLFFVTNHRLYVSEDGLATFTEVLGPAGLSLGATLGSTLPTTRYDAKDITVSIYRDIFLLTAPNLMSVILFKGRMLGATDNWTLISCTLPKPYDNAGEDEELTLVYGTTSTDPGSRAWATINVAEFTTEMGVTYRMTSSPTYSPTRTNSAASTTEAFSGLQLIGQIGGVPHYPVFGDYRGKREIYRTVDGGTVFKLLGRGTNRLLDQQYATDDGILGNTLPDSPLNNSFGGLGVEMYTESGETGNSGLGYEAHELDRQNSDIISAVITSLGVAWGIDKSRSMLRQSKPGAPFSWPIEFELGFSTGALTAIGVAGAYPIVFTESTCSRVEGFLNANGLGSQNIRTISTIIGCVHQSSVINFDNKTYFAATDSFYVTDGFRATKIAKGINRRYIKDWGVTRGSGSSPTEFATAVDSHNNRIFWAIKEGPSSRIIMHSTDDSKGLFEMTTNFLIESMHYADGVLIMADNNGYVHKLYASTDEGERDDGSTPLTFDMDMQDTDSLMPLINSVAHIDYRYKTVPISFGVELAKKWITKLLLTLTNLGTNVSIAMKSINDNDADDARDMVPAFEKVTPGSKGTHVIKRRFPAGTLRSTKKQIDLAPAYSILTNSDKLGLADYYPIGTLLGNTEPIVTLQAGSFPDISDPATSVLLQHITFEFEGYNTEHKIILASGDTLNLLTGAAGGAPILGVKWEIVGYPRDEKIRLESVTMDYRKIGEGHEAFQTSDLGANE